MLKAIIVIVLLVAFSTDEQLSVYPRRLQLLHCTVLHCIARMDRTPTNKEEITSIVNSRERKSSSERYGTRISLKMYLILLCDTQT